MYIPVYSDVRDTAYRLSRMSHTPLQNALIRQEIHRVCSERLCNRISQ